MDMRVHQGEAYIHVRYLTTVLHELSCKQDNVAYLQKPVNNDGESLIWIASEDPRRIESILKWLKKFEA